MGEVRELPVNGCYEAAKKRKAKPPKTLKATGAPKETTREEKLDFVRQDEREAAGTISTEFAEKVVCHVGLVSLSDHNKGDVEFFTSAVEALREMQPQNATQAMLAAQMIGVHEAAVRSILAVSAEGQTLEQGAHTVNRATRLMKLFIEQTEAMAKLKGESGKQEVKVEHVHVYEGGQAVVGSVDARKSNPGGGGRSEK